MSYDKILTIENPDIIWTGEITVWPEPRQMVHVGYTHLILLDGRGDVTLSPNRVAGLTCEQEKLHFTNHFLRTIRDRSLFYTIDIDLKQILDTHIEVLGGGVNVVKLLYNHPKEGKLVIYFHLGTYTFQTFIEACAELPSIKSWILEHSL